MSGTQNKLRRDTTSNIALITPAQGEAIMDTTRNALTIGDGSQAGGHYATPFSGTFTPTIGGASTFGTGSYSVQEGWYIKIGKLVVAQCRITLNGAFTGSPSGGATIAGLPFTAANIANSHSAGAIGAIGGVTHASNYTQFHAHITPFTTTANLTESGSNQTISAVPIGNVGTAADLIITFVYQAAADNN